MPVSTEADKRDKIQHKSKFKSKYFWVFHFSALKNYDYVYGVKSGVCRDMRTNRVFTIGQNSDGRVSSHSL